MRSTSFTSSVASRGCPGMLWIFRSPRETAPAAEAAAARTAAASTEIGLDIEDMGKSRKASPSSRRKPENGFTDDTAEALRDRIPCIALGTYLPLPQRFQTECAATSSLRNQTESPEQMTAPHPTSRSMFESSPKCRIMDLSGCSLILISTGCHLPSA